jgi:hypothetical protein
MDSYAYRDIGHDVLCCVGNSNRIIPNYIMHMWMKTAQNGLVAMLYGPNTIQTQIQETSVSIHTETRYPFEEKIRMTVNLKQDLGFPLLFRIPSWCKEPTILINTKPVSIDQKVNGFVRINRNWKSGDEILLNFPMTTILKQGRATNYADIKYFKKSKNARRIARVDDEINNPYASVYYGPILMALPIPDKGPNEVGEAVPVNFALNVDPENHLKGLQIEKRELPDPWTWQLEDPPLQIKVPAVKFNWHPSDIEPLPAEPVKTGSKTTINLVPYNITKFRVSMFPVTESSWMGR